MSPLYNGLTLATRARVAEGADILIVGATGSKRPLKIDFDQVLYYGGLPAEASSGAEVSLFDSVALVFFLPDVQHHDRGFLVRFCDSRRSEIQCIKPPQTIEALEELFSHLELIKRGDKP